MMYLHNKTAVAIVLFWLSACSERTVVVWPVMEKSIQPSQGESKNLENTAANPTKLHSRSPVEKPTPEDKQLEYPVIDMANTSFNTCGLESYVHLVGRAHSEVQKKTFSRPYRVIGDGAQIINQFPERVTFILSSSDTVTFVTCG